MPSPAILGPLSSLHQLLFDPVADEPLMGVKQREAKAFANWIYSLGGNHSGAALPHEYRWEVASRNGIQVLSGRAWERCSNPFHPYPESRSFPSEPGGNFMSSTSIGACAGSAFRPSRY